MYAFTSLGSGGRPPTIFCKCQQHTRFVESCNMRHAWIQRWDLHTWWLWSHPSDERTEEPEQAESQECKQCQQSHNYPSNKTKVFWLQMHWYTDCLQHCCNLKLTKRIEIMYTVSPYCFVHYQLSYLHGYYTNTIYHPTVTTSTWAATGYLQ